MLPASGDLEIPFPKGLAGLGEVLYPMTNSRYVAIGGNHGESDSRESWDLKERRRRSVRLPLDEIGRAIRDFRTRE